MFTHMRKKNENHSLLFQFFLLAQSHFGLCRDEREQSLTHLLR